MLTATHEHRGEVGTHFVCKHCGFEAGALVRCRGIGLANIFQGSSVGAQRAYHTALDHAHQTMRFVPCPSCGHRDVKEGRRILRLYWSWNVGVPMFVAAVLIVSVMVDSPPSAEWLPLVPYLVGFVAVCIAFGYILVPKPWHNIKRRVRFAAPGGGVEQRDR